MPNTIPPVSTEAMIRIAVAQGISDGIKSAVGDPEVWAVARAAARTYAVKEAGGWVLGMLKSVLIGGAKFIVMGVIVYYAGGWTLLATWLKATH